MNARGNAPNPESDETLAEFAYRRIEDMIVGLELAPGSVISELKLAAALEIGRTPIREALQRLAAEGLVLVLPKRGVLVSQVNVETQLRLLEVRRELQRLVARLSCERATTDQQKAFAATANNLLQVAETADEIAFSRLDRELDDQMWSAARNEFPAKSLSLMRGLSRRFWFVHYKQAGDLPLAARLHAGLAGAIAQRDADGAAHASDHLIDYVAGFAKDALGL